MLQVSCVGWQQTKNSACLLPVDLSGQLQLRLHCLQISSQLGFVQSQTPVLFLQTGCSEKQFIHFTLVLALLLLQLPENKKQSSSHIIHYFMFYCINLFILASLSVYTWCMYMPTSVIIVVIYDLII